MRIRAAIGCKRPEGSGGAPASASSLGERLDPMDLGTALALALAFDLDTGNAFTTGRADGPVAVPSGCLLYTSDAADDM
eukprot:3007445-Prorocentrum_lima.AAC.1